MIQEVLGTKLLHAFLPLSLFSDLPGARNARFKKDCRASHSFRDGRMVVRKRVSWKDLSVKNHDDIEKCEVGG